MPLGMEVDLDSSDIVLDGNPAPLLKKGAEPPIFGPCLLWPNGCMDQDATWYGRRPRPRPHSARWGPSSPFQKKGAHPPPKKSAHVYCAQTAGWNKIPLGMEIGVDPSDIVLDKDPAPLHKRFSCGQTTACIKMPLGVEVGLGPGHVVIDGDLAPPPQKGA